MGTENGLSVMRMCRFMRCLWKRGLWRSCIVALMILPILLFWQDVSTMEDYSGNYMRYVKMAMSRRLICGFVAVCMCSAPMFSNLRWKLDTMDEMMIPASRQEKFIARLVLVCAISMAYCILVILLEPLRQLVAQWMDVDEVFRASAFPYYLHLDVAFPQFVNMPICYLCFLSWSGSLMLWCGLLPWKYGQLCMSLFLAGLLIATMMVIPDPRIFSYTEVTIWFSGVLAALTVVNVWIGYRLYLHHSVASGNVRKE